MNETEIYHGTDLEPGQWLVGNKQFGIYKQDNGLVLMVMDKKGVDNLFSRIEGWGSQEDKESYYLAISDNGESL